uniref:PCI domain-containing protein n=1 Tax=Aegilops tauschii subsp. strangulata TaxID=200361 RepID=A0A453CVT8_AEGTS
MLIDVTPLLLFRAKLYSLTVFIHCSRASQDRTIPLSTIAEQTRLSVEDVEYLLMKSLSAHLIEGIIDGVDGTVHVSWAQPRVLGIDQVKSLRDRLDTWVGKVHTTLLSVEAETPDLVAS